MEIIRYISKHRGLHDIYIEDKNLITKGFSQL